MHAPLLVGILLIFTLLPGCLTPLVFNAARGRSPAISIDARKAGKEFEDAVPVGYAVLPLAAAADVVLIPYYTVMYGVMKANGDEDF